MTRPAAPARRRSPVVLFAAALLLAACGPGSPAPTVENEAAATLRLTSSAFAAGATIPARFTGDGDDVSPPLAWEQAPPGVSAWALVCDDPDAPRAHPWVHWVVYDLPAGTGAIPEAVPAGEAVPGGGSQGMNSWGRLGYDGPAPPPGKPHRYVFTLYALDRATGLAPGADKTAVLAAIEGHVLAEAELLGTYPASLTVQPNYSITDMSIGT